MIGFIHALAAILLVLLFAATIYSLLAIVAAWRFLSVRRLDSRSDEPVSILKPLAGLDLDLE